ncbi:MAG: acetyl-CoA carboxylase biotin carboxyl carrier protein [Planctomycetota bacterium JB042]
MAARKRKTTGGAAKKKAAPRKKTTTRKKAIVRKKGAARKGGRSGGAASNKVTVGEGEIDVPSIERLVRLMAENDLLEIEVRNGPDHQVRLSRRGEPGQVVYSAPPPPMSAPAAAPARPAAEAAAAAPAPAADPNVFEFLSPMVGTFYRAPNPESPPYVTTGDRVSEDAVLCIIEAMKVLNEIKAEVKGEVVDILVENGEAVEYGQPLFLIRKSG